MIIDLTLSSEYRTRGTSDNFEIDLDQPLILTKPHKLALVSLNTWFSWYNISASNQNNIFRYSNGSTFKNIVISDGQYTFQDLISYIESKLREDGDWDSANNEYYLKIKMNINTGKIMLDLSNGYQVDFSHSSSPYYIFGADPVIYSTTQLMPNQARITNGVNSILLHCNLVNGSPVLGTGSSDVIDSFVARVPPHNPLFVKPESLVYHPVTRETTKTVHIYLTDQDNNSISLNGEPFTCRLYIKEL